MCSQFVWEARRHRRNKPQKYQLPKKPRFPTLFSWAKFKDNMSSAQKMVSFCIGPLFVLGSLLFILGGIATVLPGAYQDKWSQTKVDLLINYPYLVRCLSVTLSLLEYDAVAAACCQQVLLGLLQVGVWAYLISAYIGMVETYAWAYLITAHFGSCQQVPLGLLLVGAYAWAD